MTVRTEVVRFRGHPEVRATHGRTIEITRELRLTPNGDCIVGVGADRGLTDLPESLRRELSAGVRVRFIIEAGEEAFSFYAAGDPRLGFSSERDMVIRKSDYVCGRTLAVRSEAAAVDLPRSIVSSLRRSSTEGKLAIEVEA